MRGIFIRWSSTLNVDVHHGGSRPKIREEIGIDRRAIFSRNTGGLLERRFIDALTLAYETIFIMHLWRCLGSSLLDFNEVPLVSSGYDTSCASIRQAWA